MFKTSNILTTFISAVTESARKCDKGSLVTVPALQDTYLVGKDPEALHHTELSLKVGVSGDNMFGNFTGPIRSLIQFDLRSALKVTIIDCLMRSSMIEGRTSFFKFIEKTTNINFSV